LANDFGLGAYSLSPSGQLRWNNPGSPPISWYGGTGSETVLGPRTGGMVDQMYVVSEPQLSTWTFQAFSLADGSLRFSVPIGGQHDPFGQQQTQAAVGPNGTIYITHMRASGGIGWVLEAYSPLDGHTLWYYHGSAISGMTPPDVGPDGIVYYSQDIARIIAFNPNTQLPIWQYTDGTLMYHPTVSPLNSMVVTGGVLTFGEVGFVKAIRVSSGQLLWTVPLPGAPYPEPRVFPVHHPRFTPDGNTVYVSTTILAGNESNPHSYLYAIATGQDSMSGVIHNSDVSSFKLFQNYPNPFNAETNIKFQIPDAALVSMKVYDMLGSEVSTLVNEQLKPGEYEVTFNAAELASGVYYYKLTAGMYSETKKLILIR
jgi:outer membrane protein assembly factor BamB